MAPGDLLSVLHFYIPILSLLQDSVQALLLSIDVNLLVSLKQTNPSIQ